jgi:membrane-bound lytic murein transglycosylase F
MTLSDLTGMTITVPDDDPFRADLPGLLRSRGVRPRLVGGPPQAGPEDLLEMLRRGEVEAVVVDDLLARAALVHAPGLHVGPALDQRRPTAWLLRDNSSELLAALNHFLKGHLWASGSGRSRRSRDYGIIHERYFSNRITIQDFRVADHRPDKSGRISPYDTEVRRQAKAAGLDWRLVSALMFQESRFDPGAVSQADARGLMQVLPGVAGAQADSLFEPTANMRAGIRLLATAWQRYAYLDSLDRLRFSLAEYHAGFGHLNDARRIAMDLARDPNAWTEGAATTLPLLLQRRWHVRTRHGFYGGDRTVAYVNAILARYRAYMRLVPRDPPERDEPPPTAPLAVVPEMQPAPSEP